MSANLKLSIKMKNKGFTQEDYIKANRKASRGRRNKIVWEANFQQN